MHPLRLLPWTALTAVLAIAPSCGGGSSGDSRPEGTYFYLSGIPNPSTVFDSPEVCFTYENNLTNSIWHANSALVLTGDFEQSGYWSHPSNTGGHPSSPDNGTEGYRRLVHMPRTELVAYTVSPAGGGIGTSVSADLRLATLDRTTGILGAGAVAVFSDGYTGTCNVLSSSIDELFILESGTSIRRYSTAAGSDVLTFVDAITLSQAVPTLGLCEGACYGGTFAWDGRYFYVSRDQQSSPVALAYDVFDGSGTFVATYTANGTGSMNGVYFDWSVGRYASHDGWGMRLAATTHASLSGDDSDSQCYGAVSGAHTFHP